MFQYELFSYVSFTFIYNLILIILVRIVIILNFFFFYESDAALMAYYKLYLKNIKTGNKDYQKTVRTS